MDPGGNRRPVYANTGYGPHFDLIDVGLDDYVCLINGDTAFWALIERSRSIRALTGNGLARHFGRRAAYLKREMEGLRFGLTPSAVYFNPTERCNLDCRYCYLPRPMRRRGFSMRAEELCRALTILRTYFSSALPRGVRPEVVFHGSEPLLARDAVFEGIERFCNDFRFGLQTNATLLEDEAIDFLAKHEVSIGISLDAHRAQIADLTRRDWRGNGSFNKVAAALERLADYPSFSVICTVSKANVRSLTKIIEFFHRNGVQVALLNPVRCTLEGGRELKAEDRLLAREFLAALDRAYELWQETGRKLIVANFANVLLGIVAPAARRLMCDISPCGGGRCFFAVSANGDVFPCSEFIGMPDFRGGNLFREDLASILKTDPFRQVTGRKVEDFEPCAHCAIRHFCGAPCPAEIHACQGSMSSPSAYCEFFEEQIRYAFRVIAFGREDAYLWDDWKRGTIENLHLNAL